jgi:hypothetical protein
VIHQVKYSMLERGAEEGLFPALEAEGLGCIVFSPLAQGLLTDRYLRDIPADSRAAKPHGALQGEAVTPERCAQLGSLAALAEARGQTLAQLAIAWVLRQSVVTSALVGASRVRQLEDNVAAGGDLADPGGLKLRRGAVFACRAAQRRDMFGPASAPARGRAFHSNDTQPCLNGRSASWWRSRDWTVTTAAPR